MFIKKTDAEAETPVLDPDARKDWRQKKKGAAEDEIVTITDSMDMNLSKIWEIVKDRGAWHAAVHGFAKNWTQISNSMTCAFFGFFQQHLIVFRVHVLYFLKNVDFLVLYFFWCDGKWDGFFIFLSDLLLFYRDVTDFYVLLLYPATLQNSLMSSISFLVASFCLFVCYFFTLMKTIYYREFIKELLNDKVQTKQSSNGSIMSEERS